MPLLLGIIALLVIGGGVYVYKNKKAEVPVVANDVIAQQANNQNTSVNTQKNDSSVIDTSNWKTYINTKYGFEFKYPVAGYLLWVNDDSNLGSVTEDVKTDDPEYLGHFRFNVVISNQPVDNIDNYARSVLEAPNTDRKYISSEYLNINGIKWLKVKLLDDFINGENYCYFFYSNNKIYVIDFYGEPSVDLEKIPSTCWRHC